MKAPCINLNVNAQDETGNSALHFACSNFYSHTDELPPHVLALLNHPEINLNMANKEGCTPLMLAAKYGASALVFVLLNADVDITIHNNEDRNAEVIASLFSHKEIYDEALAKVKEMNDPEAHASPYMRRI